MQGDSDNNAHFFLNKLVITQPLEVLFHIQNEKCIQTKSIALQGVLKKNIRFVASIYGCDKVLSLGDF